jgi:general secretion pathway protein G
MKRLRKPTQRRPGFTLIEVLLVLVILGVLAALVVPNLLGTQERANINAAKASIKGLESTLDLYRTEHNATYPQTLNDLLAPKDISTGQPMRAYLDKVPLDPWGQPLNYEWPNNKVQNSQTALKPAIWSNGPNMQNENGSGDDIGNWPREGAGI